MCRHTWSMQHKNLKPNVTMCAFFPRWGVCLLICCVILLVVVCNLLGLLLGPLGLKSKADPTERSCTADCGGTFLMMWVLIWNIVFIFSHLSWYFQPVSTCDLWPGWGRRGAGFSFLFSWIFMIIVLLLFLLGGHSYTLLCQTWKNGQLLKVAIQHIATYWAGYSFCCKTLC